MRRAVLPPLIAASIGLVAWVGIIQADSLPPVPRGLHLEAGLERPYDKEYPNPYVKISWEHTPDNLRTIGIDIKRTSDRVGRPSNPYATRFDYLWMLWEGPTLALLGCEVGETFIKLTDDCLDSYRTPLSVYYDPFPIDFLRPGERYSVQVMFKNDLGKEGFSRIRYITIPELPRLSTPTPRPEPTAIPWPTATPRPTPTPTPTPLPEVSVESLFAEHPALQAVYYFDNEAKVYKVARHLERGKPYFFKVSRTTQIHGHNMSCSGEFCWNVVSW